ncbi:MAG: HNH endonuclease [Akkermansiaceae bacterium]
MVNFVCAGSGQTRDKFTCKYFGRTPKDGTVLHVDHVASVNDKGSNELDNLVAACLDCNLGKGKNSIEL